MPAIRSSEPIGLVDVLDRLQEHHGVDLLVEVLDEPPLEAQVGAAVAGAGVLVSLGVRVDADHLGRAPASRSEP